MADWTVKKGNFGFIQEFEIKQANGDPKDLTGLTVTLKVWSNAGNISISGQCTITDAANGKCTYTPKKNDFSTAGDYTAELELTKGNTYVEDTDSFRLHIKTSV